MPGLLPLLRKHFPLLPGIRKSAGLPKGHQACLAWDAAFQRWCEAAVAESRPRGAKLEMSAAVSRSCGVFLSGQYPRQQGFHEDPASSREGAAQLAITHSRLLGKRVCPLLFKGQRALPLTVSLVPRKQQKYRTLTPNHHSNKAKSI